MFITFIITVALLTFIIAMVVRHRRPRAADRFKSVSARVRSRYYDDDDNYYYEDALDDEKLYIRYTENPNYKKGLELWEQGDDIGAYAHLLKALEDDPKNGYAWGAIAPIDLKYKKYGQALETIDVAQECLPYRCNGWLCALRAQVYLEMYDFEACKNELREAFQYDIDDFETLEVLTDFLIQNKEYDDYDSTEECLKDFCKNHPGNTDGYMLWGHYEMAHAHYEEALMPYLRAMMLDPTFVDAAYIAEANLRLDRTDDAIEFEIVALSLMAEFEKECPQAMTILHILAEYAGDPFILKLKEQLATGEHETFWQAMLSSVLAYAGRHREAAHYYHKANSKICNVNGLAAEATCWRQLGNYAMMAELLRKAVAEDPNNTDLQCLLAIALGEIGEHDECIQINDALIAQKPDFAPAYYNRAQMKLMSGMYESAIEDFSTVLTLGQGHIFDTFFYRGLCEMLAGDKEAADQDFDFILEEPGFFTDGRYLMLAELFKKGPEAFRNADGSLTPAYSDFMQEVDEDVRKLLDAPRMDDDNQEEVWESCFIQAAIRCRVGDVAGALASVRAALQLGDRRFYYYRHAFLLQPLHGNEEFIQMLDEAERETIASWSEAQDDDLQ